MERRDSSLSSSGGEGWEEEVVRSSASPPFIGRARRRLDTAPCLRFWSQQLFGSTRKSGQRQFGPTFAFTVEVQPAWRRRCNRPGWERRRLLPSRAIIWEGW